MLTLTPSDFTIKQDLLSTRIRGFSFVFFGSNSCEFCAEVFPVFRAIAQMLEKNMTFAVMNVDQQNNRIVHMSINTKLPLEHVPFLILFKDGMPVEIFNADEEDPAKLTHQMQLFLSTVLVGDKPASTGQQSTRQCIITDTTCCAATKKRVCYLPYSNAYTAPSARMQ